MTALVSVIMPVYNGADLIRTAIDSILAQTYSNLELIVIDDGSKDGTAEVVESIEDSRVRLVRQANAGVAAARNTGIALASGSIVAFLDHDDAWFPHKLEVQVAYMAEHDAAIVGAYMTYLGPRGPMRAQAGEFADDKQQRIRDAILMPFPPSSMIVRRDALDQAGPFDAELVRNTGPIDDLDMVAKIARLGPVLTYPEALGMYRVHGNAASFTKFFEMARGTRFLQARFKEPVEWEEWLANNPSTPAETRMDKARFYYRRAGFAYAGGQWLKAVWSGAAAFVLAPRFVVERGRRQFV